MTFYEIYITSGIGNNNKHPIYFKGNSEELQICGYININSGLYSETRQINSIDTSISNKAAERLSEYMPRGCPFNGYTLLDLLKDLVRMYGYHLEWHQTMTMTEFIRYLMGINIHAKVYGEAIIQLIEEE